MSPMPIILFLLLLQSSEELFRTGNADMAAGRWGEAARKYERILEDDPTHIPSQFSLAVCYAKTGNVNGALELYRRILDQDSTVYEARINLAILLEENGRLADAAQEFDKAAALRAGDANARLAAGLLFMRLGETEKAYDHLTAAESAGSEAPQLFIALSETAHLMGDEQRSLEYLEKARARDPDNKALSRQLGIMYREAGRLPDAIDVLEGALPEAKLELAVTYFDSEQYEQAAPLFAELSQADPSNVDYLYMFGKSMMEVKRYPAAISTMRRVIQIKPDYFEAYGDLGSIYYIQENWAAAAQFLLRFVELTPPQAAAHFVLATCFDRLGNARDALLHYNRFLELDDGSNDARSFQARQRARLLERQTRE